MIINNKLDYSFGKPGIFAGVILMVLGGIVILHIWPVVLVFMGAFMTFTHSGVQMDTEKGKIRLYQNLFGIIKSGKWRPVIQYTGLTIIPVKRLTKVMSLSNRSTTLEQEDIRIFLLDKNHKPDIPVKKCKSLADGQDRMDELSLWLKLPVYSPKH